MTLIGHILYTKQRHSIHQERVYTKKSGHADLIKNRQWWIYETRLTDLKTDTCTPHLILIVPPINVLTESSSTHDKNIESPPNTSLPVGTHCGSGTSWEMALEMTGVGNRGGDWGLGIGVRKALNPFFESMDKFHPSPAVLASPHSIPLRTRGQTLPI